MGKIVKVNSQRNKSIHPSKASETDLPLTKDSPVDQILDLQQIVGNQTVQGILKSETLQPKLKIGEPGDKYELEADRMAGQVMRMPDSVCPTCVEKKEEEIVQPKPISGQITPLVQRQVEDVEKKKREEEMFQAKEDNGGLNATADITTSIDSLRSKGEPLSEATRSYFEPRFGYDFSGVRIHTGDEAEKTAKSINARAFTVGNDVILGASNYSPETGEGKKLLAHELTHTIQQKQSTFVPKLQRYPADDVTSMSITPSYADGLTNEQLFAAISSVTEQLRMLSTSDIVYDSARSNLTILQAEATRRGLMSFAPAETSLGMPSGSTTMSIPANVTYSIVSIEPSSFGWGSALGRSTAIGGARGLGFLISPPVRGFYDPFLPLTTRLGGGRGPLGSLGGGRYGVERYTSMRFLREMRPRYMTESGELALLEMTGTSPWATTYNIKGRDLERIPGLISKMSEGGLGTLSASEQALLRTFFRAHAYEGLTFASPAMSGSISPGLSSSTNVAGFLRGKSYVVRIEVPASTVGEVNAMLGTNRPEQLVRELEVLVTSDARGNITNIRPNPTSGLAKAAPYLRWGGRALIVVGIGISSYRIGTATEEERPRVIGEEAGGWAGGLGGAALAGAGCAAFGAITSGVGLLICGLVGGIAGGVGGSAVGGIVGENIGKHGTGASGLGPPSTDPESLEFKMWLRYHRR